MDAQACQGRPNGCGLENRECQSLIKVWLDVPTARMIASMVEDGIFSMGITTVPTSLIKQIVLSEAALVGQTASAG
jgi:hypothetical protein